MFFTSDLHFYHKHICKYTDRPDMSVEEHTDWLVNIWNSQVSKNDIIYSLGDFAFHAKTDKIVDVVSRLNGNIIFIKGNHCDRRAWKKTGYTFKDYTSTSILVNGERVQVCMFHFPIFEWDGQKNGSFHLHGHSHGALQMEGKALDVGIDNAYNILGEHRLFSIDDIISFMSRRDTSYQKYRTKVE